ncbi:MAG: iron complex outermembrane receptor protein [Halioglobus sp.]|jgi:iron complex outermembrane receptor protein
METWARGFFGMNIRKTSLALLKAPQKTSTTLTLIATLVGTNASAQTLEEVLVTASKRTQSLQDVAMTVTAFTDQEIQDAGINNADDLSVLTPSLTITTNQSPFTASIRIRGIGTSQTDIALEPSVGLFVDDVYLGRSGLGMSDLTDIERIEILQGPQGTLYGKNTNAGAISIFTKGPNREEFEAYAETTVGNYDLRKVTLAASGPLSDTLAYRISGNIHEHDGYLENATGDDLNGADDWNLIGKLLWDPTENLSLLLNANHVDRDSKCCGADSVQSDATNAVLEAQGLPVDNNDPFDYEIAVDEDNVFTSEADSVSLVINYGDDWGDIKAITAWNEYENVRAGDVDRSPLDVISQSDARGSGDSFSQEVRYTSPTGGAVDYQVGVFYYESQTVGGEGNPFTFLGDDLLVVAPQFGALGQPGDSIRADVVLDTQNIAVFGQSTWHVNERLRFTGGLRWTDEEKEADLLVAIDSTAPADAIGASFFTLATTPVDDVFSRTTSDVNWLLNASFDAIEDLMVFASVSTGSKSGGFNTVNGAADEREFEDESTISYEIGIKSLLLDSRLRVNAATFYTEIEDYQFQQQLETGIGTSVSNQAEVEVSGLELEVQALPFPNLTLAAGLQYLWDYDITAGPQEGNNLSLTAELSGNLSATFVIPLADGGVYMRGDYSYMDDHVTGATGDEPRPQDIQDRNLLNARIGFRNDHWNVSLWGKNLTQDEYAALTAATLPVTGVDAYFLAPPRTYGATLRYSF